MRCTRRQLLGVGCGIAATMSLGTLAAVRPAAAHWRIGLLQAARPWLDPHDLPGSQARAVQALVVTIARVLDEQGPIDWLVGGPTALPEGDVPATSLLQPLAALAARRGLRLSFGTRRPGADARLLEFGAAGTLHWTAARTEALLPGGAMQLTLREGGDRWTLRVAPAAPQWAAPLAPAPLGGATQVVDPRGRVIAAADGSGEGLVVAAIGRSRHS